MLKYLCTVLTLEYLIRTLFIATYLRHQHVNSKGQVKIHKSLKAGRSILNTVPIFILVLLLLNTNFKNWS